MRLYTISSAVNLSVLDILIIIMLMKMEVKGPLERRRRHEFIHNNLSFLSRIGYLNPQRVPLFKMTTWVQDTGEEMTHH